VEVGRALIEIATAAIDVSDGVAADLNHILEMSGAGAHLDVEKLPLSECFPAVFNQVGGWVQPLTAGDDYELLFTAPEESHAKLQQIAAEYNCSITCIGQIEEQSGLRCCSESKLLEIQNLGYEHFK
jgi:thiamine-monophosphate kinase